MMQPFLRFEELSRRADVNATTLRYYIRLGLLPESQRAPAGHREYPVSALSRLAAIKRAKNLGFTLKEIKDMFEDGGWTECIATTKLESLEAHIAQLIEQRDALLKIKNACEGSERCALISHITEGERWEERV